MENNKNEDVVLKTLNKWAENKSNFVNLPEDKAVGLQDSIKDLLEIYKLQKEVNKEITQNNDHLDYAYKELRKNFNKITDEILGEDYYNMGIDTYNCDQETAEDLLYKYKELKNEIRFYKIPYIICAMLWCIVLFTFINERYSNYPNIILTVIAYLIPVIMVLLVKKLFNVIRNKD